MNDDIVLVDDDELTLELVKRRLQKTAIRLKCFSDGEQAIEYLSDNASSVLLIDYRMPKLNGLEVLRKLALANRLLPARAYLCSAAELPSNIRDEALSIGARILSKDSYRKTDDLLNLLAGNQPI